MSIMSPSTNETSAIVSVWSCPAVPTPALPPNPSLIWQLLPGLRNMPPGTFFFWAPTFSFNCQRALWSNCSHTPRNIQPGKCQPHTVTLAPSPDYSSTALANTWEGEREGVRVVSGNKRRGIVGHAAQQKLSQCYSEKKRPQGKCKKKS